MQQIQHLEMDASALRRKNQALELELSNHHADKPGQQRVSSTGIILPLSTSSSSTSSWFPQLEIDLRYTRAELAEARQRLQERNRDVAKKDEQIAVLERRMSEPFQSSTPGHTSQSQVKQLEERLAFLTLENQRLQQHQSQRRYSQPPSSVWLSVCLLCTVTYLSL